MNKIIYKTFMKKTTTKNNNSNKNNNNNNNNNKKKPVLMKENGSMQLHVNRTNNLNAPRTDMPPGYGVLASETTKN